MTESKRADTFTKFQFQGKLLENPAVQTSAKGNSYSRVKLECGVGPQKFPRKFLAVAFGEIAEQIADGSAQGDIILLSGSIEPQRRQDGTWDNSFVAKSFKLVEQALQNSPELVDAAMGAADDDSIPF